MRAGLRRRAGFTLVELVLVMLMLCVILAIAVPQLKGFLTSSGSRDAATQLVAITQYARGKAAADARAYRLTFDLTAKEYYLTMQDDTANDGSFAPLGDDFGRVFALPVRMQVEILRPNSTSVQSLGLNTAAAPDDIDFRPDGTCDPAIIRLTDGDGFITYVAAPSPAESFRVMTEQEVNAI